MNSLVTVIRETEVERLDRLHRSLAWLQRHDGDWRLEVPFRRELFKFERLSISDVKRPFIIHEWYAKNIVGPFPNGPSAAGRMAFAALREPEGAPFMKMVWLTTMEAIEMLGGCDQNGWISPEEDLQYDPENDKAVL